MTIYTVCSSFSDWLWFSLQTQVAGFDQTTGLILILRRQRTILSPVESLLVLDLQDGGVMVQDGQDDFVHVLSQP